MTVKNTEESNLIKAQKKRRKESLQQTRNLLKFLEDGKDIRPHCQKKMRKKQQMFQDTHLPIKIGECQAE
jgi:hypothetical protein